MGVIIQGQHQAIKVEFEELLVGGLGEDGWDRAVEFGNSI